MNSKKAKKIRKTMKLTGQDVTAPAQYFISKKTPKMVYVLDEQTKLPVAKVIEKLTLINGTKNKYRKVKKMLQKVPRNQRAA